jgi:hypothetical protein
MKIMIRSLAATIRHWPAIEEEQQRVIFAGLGAFALEIPVGRKHRQDADAITRTRKKVAKPSTTSRFEKAKPGTELAPTAAKMAAINARWRGARKASGLLGEEGIENHQQRAGDGEDDFGREAQQIVAAGRET